MNQELSDGWKVRDPSTVRTNSFPVQSQDPEAAILLTFSRMWDWGIRSVTVDAEGYDRIAYAITPRLQFMGMPGGVTKICGVEVRIEERKRKY